MNFVSTFATWKESDRTFSSLKANSPSTYLPHIECLQPRDFSTAIRRSCWSSKLNYSKRSGAKQRLPIKGSGKLKKVGHATKRGYHTTHSKYCKRQCEWSGHRTSTLSRRCLE